MTTKIDAPVVTLDNRVNRRQMEASPSADGGPSCRIVGEAGVLGTRVGAFPAGGLCRRDIASKNRDITVQQTIAACYTILVSYPDAFTIFHPVVFECIIHAKTANKSATTDHGIAANHIVRGLGIDNLIMSAIDEQIPFDSYGSIQRLMAVLEPDPNTDLVAVMEIIAVNSSIAPLSVCVWIEGDTAVTPSTEFIIADNRILHTF